MAHTLLTSFAAREYFAKHRVSPPGVVPVVMATVKRLAALEEQTVAQAATIAELQAHNAQLETELAASQAELAECEATCADIRSTVDDLPAGLAKLMRRVVDDEPSEPTIA